MPHFTGCTPTFSSKHRSSRDASSKHSSEGSILEQKFHSSINLQESKHWFNNQKKILSSKRMLFEDPFFSATDESISFSTRPTKKHIWKRPKEICNNPEFISAGASRFDVRQGELGDCWLLAAVASLSLNEKLFVQVVPDDQSFNDATYIGAFLFRFWQGGSWIDIVVDDRLPTYNNKLVFMHSTDKNEFWSALLEKAYAKLVSSYEALKGGSTCEAMVDFTGGITEMFTMGDKTAPNLWKILKKAINRCSLMGCSIDADASEIEAKGDLGLIRGHAYSVTDVKVAKTKTGDARLVRVRNPWGNEAEWEGAWSDKSSEWNMLSTSERERLGLTFEDDGEFWMSFEDFTRYFTKLEICHLSPETDVSTTVGREKKRKWEMCIEEGEWKRNVSAGGCRNFINTFHMNPQFRINVVDPDEDDDDNMGTVIVGLMQLGMRSKRAEGVNLFSIGYAIYQLKDNKYDNQVLDSNFFRSNAMKSKSDSFIDLREVCCRHKLPPGRYVIVPSTFNANEEAQFILRIFSEQPYSSEEVDQSTDIVDVKKTIERSPEEAASENEATEKLKAAFNAIAGFDKEISGDELRDILNAAFKKESFQFDGFSRETCRSMVAMMDYDQSGKLGFDEFKELWDDVRLWKTVFKKFDADKSGTFNSSELRNALNHVGFKISNAIFKPLTTRYTASDGSILFDDYILLLVRLRTVFLTFKNQRHTSEGDAIFKQDDFIRCIVYM